jgi:hypothetical protein
MASPVIEIDGITFRIISYNPEANNEKRRIVYESSAPGRDPEQYAAYRSSSEMGFWRLCLGTERMEKGTDYVQASFIHLELQKYFNTIIQTSDIPPATYFLPSFNNTAKQTQYLEDNEAMNLIPLPSCYYIKKEKNEKIKAHLRDYQTRPVQVEELKPYLKAGCGSTKAYEELFKGFSNFIESSPLFDVESVELIYPGYTFAAKISVDTITFQADIYCCNFTSNARLYFMKYDLTVVRDYGGPGGPERPKTVTGNFAPVIFIPRTATITEFGTYSQYILGGAYICKIFDYNDPKQITQKEKRNSRIPFGDYAYIGNRYTNLYPYKYMRVQEDNSLVFVRPPPSPPGPLRIRVPQFPEVKSRFDKLAALQREEISPKTHLTETERSIFRERLRLLGSLPRKGKFARNKAVALANAERRPHPPPLPRSPTVSPGFMSKSSMPLVFGGRKKTTRKRKNRGRRTYRRSH